MQMSLTVEERLDRIEQLLRGQKKDREATEFVLRKRRPR